jgi:hypothetical protein
MKVEFYPTLDKAVKSLKKGECFYTDSRFLLDPVRILYKREARSVYKATGLDHGEITWDIGGDKIVVSSHIEKSGEKYVYPTLLKGKELVRLWDVENLYKLLILKTEELEKLIEGLDSLVEKNRGVFKKPLRDVMSLGLKRINTKNKDLVLIEYLSGQSKQTGISDFFRKQIMKSTRDEEWKKKISSYSLYLGNRAERELYKTLSNLTRGVETDIYWEEALVVVDRAPGGGTVEVISEFWENNGILGIEIEGVQKLMQDLQDHLNKHGKWSLEKSFPNLLGKIDILTSNPTKRENAEFALVPLYAEEKGGVLRVDYLALVKLVIKDKEFSWLSVKPIYIEGEVEMKTSDENTVRILSKDEVPEGVLTEDKERKSKTVLVKASFLKKIEISPHTPISVQEIEYNAILKGFTRAISIGESPEMVEELKEIEEGRTTSEVIRTILFLKGKLNPRIRTSRDLEEGECLGKEVDEQIAREMRMIAAEIEKYEEKEKDNERKGALKAAKFVAERISEVFEKGKIVKSRCHKIRSDKSSYQYEAYPTYSKEGEIISAEGHRPIVEEKEFSDIIREYLSPEMKEAEKAARILKSEKGLKVCFSSGEEKVIIRIDDLEEISKNGKEKIILRNASRNVVREFLKNNYSGKIVKEDGESLVNEEIKETDELALKLSGIIVSSVIYPWKNLVPIGSSINNKVMEHIYKGVFKTITGGSYINRDYTNREGQRKVAWLKTTEPMINGKALLQNAIGALIEVDIIEKISLKQTGNEEPVISLYTEAKDKYLQAKPIFFLETGIMDMVAEVKMK